MDKGGPGEYLTMKFIHFLLSCNPFWRSSNFLDTIGPSRSVCHGSFPVCKHRNWESTHSNTSGLFLTKFWSSVFRKKKSPRIIVGKYLSFFILFCFVIITLQTGNIENIASWQEWKNSTQNIASEYCSLTGSSMPKWHKVLKPIFE